MIIWCLISLFIETSLVLLETANYVVKPIQFCPLVTLDGNISHYLDTGAHIHQSAISAAECSLLCTVNQVGRCAGFTHDPLTGKCSIHYSGPFTMASVVLSSPAYPTTHLIFPMRLYYEVHISGCLFPFTLNGTMYRESCAVAYECPIGRCNFAMCPTLFQEAIDSQPHAQWVICSPFRAYLPSASNVRDIWCLNSTFAINSTQLLPSKWILVQSRSTGSDFDKSWKDYKAGFGVEFQDYWIGNEAFHLLTSMNCTQLFKELPPSTTSTTSTTSEPTSPLSSLYSNRSTYYSPAPQLPSTSSSSSLNNQKFDNLFVKSNISMTTLSPPFEASSGFTKKVTKYKLKMHKYWRLRLEMESREDGKWYSVEYNSVYMDSEEQSYSLQVNNFDAQSSDAGDGFNSSSGLPFAISSTSDGVNEGWWRGCSGSLNAKEAFWPDSSGGFFHPTRTRMFLQPVSKIFNVSTVVWV